MAAPTAHDLLDRGLQHINATTDDDRRWKHYEGRGTDLYAPRGVNTEYTALQEMAGLPLIRLAVRTPCQRVRMEALRFGPEARSLEQQIARVMRVNRLGSRQRILYVHSLVFGYGVASVWPNPANPEVPVVRVENPLNLYMHYDANEPGRLDYVVKVSTPESDEVTGEIPPAKAWLYTDAKVRVYEGRSGVGATAYDLIEEFPNPFGRIPFVVFAPEAGSTGEAVSMVDALIPQQQAIDTMRFNLLLAAQFAAFRQRVITGYDPVRRDEDGNPVWRTDADGEPILDSDGNPEPIIDGPGAAGVDRLFVFPGADTKVFDLEESDLTNYVQALDMLVAAFASTAQVPPQYLVGDFKNVSGDLMTATEATLRSFVADLHAQFDDSWLDVFDLVMQARGESLPDSAQAVWADAEPKSLQQIASATSQMVPNGAPLRMFLEMMPNATVDKVDRWMSLSQNAMDRALSGDLAAGAFGPKPDDGDEAA